MPTTMAVSPGCGRATLRALYVVTPAQVMGAASNEETPSGTATTWRVADGVLGVRAVHRVALFWGPAQ